MSEELKQMARMVANPTLLFESFVLGLFILFFAFLLFKSFVTSIAVTVCLVFYLLFIGLSFVASSVFIFLLVAGVGFIWVNAR